MSNASNVISGPATLYVAVGDGSVAPPTLTGVPSTDFPSPTWTQPGYTDKGIEFDYASTDKDIDVDELTSPVDVLITAEKLTITVSLAETTLANLAYAISGSTLASATEITIGGKIRPNRFMLGVAGPAPNIGTGAKLIREILIYTMVPKGTVKMHYQRKDKIVYTAQFQALGLSSKPLGQNLCDVKDF
jgi:hypothetical protein